ncbi:interactor of constitutive active ROPs 4 [Macadamia integrifolia]|uniref:interactor of constitutive active ROPs 4 n=1 Tax=Macadamia integrifolia TaxID=60698 RepID=UPI001C52D257|nr:interactor of constitutive active ROPs 4 [Macadamia integrifolia]XP_042520619.1 interactor of constitutive active ROPs 4 [Macadamia integrifolia]XP_042520620.1 interactor of constitutive active ROPs 4 [Macadamia integrifolia]XP_042520621.1 interactor of constitutive active ROPs 4 [Macadamia integrifolia]
MPRSRGSELPQRQSPRGPLSVRASSSDSDSHHNHHHHRPIVDRSPKLGVAERRSPRGSQPDSLQQKKLGTRISDLESQLGNAQEELKKLKDQLASAEASKKEVQAELQKKAQKPEAAVKEAQGELQKKPPKSEAAIKEAQGELEMKSQKPIVSETQKEDQHQPPSPEEVHESSSNEKNLCDPDQSTDVFEVPVETKPQHDPKVDFTETVAQKEEEEEETKRTEVEKCVEPPSPPTQLLLEPEKPSPDNSAQLKEEINSLNEKLTEKVKELEISREENERLKRQAKEAGAKAASALANEEESILKLNKIGEELEESKVNLCRLKEKHEAVEAAKEVLETEMKKLKVQTEQWKKAADAAAAILSDGVEMNGRRVAVRCGSMDKHIGSGFGAADGFGGIVGSPLMADDLDDGFEIGKRKGAGMRMFSDLWKKKGQK